MESKKNILVRTITDKEIVKRYADLEVNKILTKDAKENA